jgi:ABC-2 type transport system ATP-binding protein
MIQAMNVTKKFEDFTALDSISCRIPNGCIYGMVGSNGAGKSTFLRLMSGVYRADSGEIRIDEENVYDNEKVKNRIAYVPDELYFLPGSSMDRMADLYQVAYQKFDRKRYQYLTESFGLNPKKNLNTFSKGMRRQAATILALSAKPEYIFFDETFDGLDPVMRNLVKGLICQDVLERKATAIITSHSLRELEDTCDQLALLHKGGMIFESDIQNLKTSLFKVQIAFREDYDQSLFEGIEILHYVKRGSVANLIVRGERDTVMSQLYALNPTLAEVLPLTLEEVFTYEMEALGYHFSAVLEGDHYE